jgi:hypothetical protein
MGFENEGGSAASRAFSGGAPTGRVNTSALIRTIMRRPVNSELPVSPLKFKLGLLALQDLIIGNDLDVSKILLCGVEDIGVHVGEAANQDAKLCALQRMSEEIFDPICLG